MSQIDSYKTRGSTTKSRLISLAIRLIKVKRTSNTANYALLLMYMKRWNRHIMALVLMSLSICVLLVFQIFWLQKEFKQQQEVLRTETNSLFAGTMRDLQDSLVKRIILSSDTWHSQTSLREVFLFKTDEASELSPQADSLNNKMLKIDSAENRITINNLRMTVTKDSADTEESIKQDVLEATVLAFRALGSAGQFTVNGSDSTTLTIAADSLKIEQIQEAFTTTLTENDLDLDVTIWRLDSLGANLNLTGLTTQKHKGDFSMPTAYQAEFPNYGWYILRQILPQILFSLFLISITCLSFWLIFQNLQQQRRLTTLKNEFISNVTHELKTPITTVSVAIEALENFDALQNPARTQEYLQISKNELSRLSLLVDKVLRMSVFEKQEPELKLTEFDLKALVEEVVNSMKLQFERFEAEVDVLVAEGDYTIQADRIHIMSVIYNLVDNALKYSPDNPAIDIRLQPKGEFVELSVKDNGIGIPAEYQDKIFDKFFRVPTGDRHNIKGHGRGLSYIASVIEEHGGTISLQSKLHEGSTFTVRLPQTSVT